MSDQPAPTRPVLSLSLDLDNLWSYMKTHGDPGWETFPTYLDELTEIVLDRLAKHELRITFFIVGQDAALGKNRAALRAIADAGHEIGNHSFHHEPWIQGRTVEDIDREIEAAEAAIESVAGRCPRGFRGPGYSLSAQTLEVLSARGYLYDASTFPTYLGPLARMYYLWNAPHLHDVDRERRSTLFGSLKDGRRPLRPYLWKVNGNALVEIPVTTMPATRIPFHLSYLIYLSGISRPLGLAYLRAALTACRAARVEPSFLLHPLDFIGGDRVKQLAFFPGMNLPTAFKLDLFEEVIGHIKQEFRIITMEEHAARSLRELLAPGGIREHVFAG